MAKANKRAIESDNFWDMRIVHGRFAGTPRVDVNETKILHNMKKFRLHDERIRRRHLYFAFKEHWGKRKQHRNKRQIKHNQIQYGFDIAKWMMEQHV